MSAVLKQVSLELRAYNQTKYYQVTGHNNTELKPLFESFKQADKPLQDLSVGLPSFFGGNGKFFISKVQLKEGISLSYSGVITLAATKALNKQTVRALAGCGARLHLCLGEDKLSWDRYIYGFIRDIHFCGTTQSGENTSGDMTYLYELNLHSPLEKLRHRHSAFKFSAQDVTAVVEKLLEPLGNDLEIIKESSFSDFTKNKEILAGRGNVTYQQARENDLEFLQRLLLLYGFNYVFVHLKSKGKVCLYLSHNTEKMFSAYPLDESVDKAPVSADARLVKCNLYGEEKRKPESDDNVYRLKSLDFLTSYHEQDEQDEYVNRELCADGYYPAARNDLGVAALHNRLYAKNNLSTALSQRSNTYYCECSQLVFLPGRVAEVSDAYGADGKENLLITKSLIEVVNPTPVGQLKTVKTENYDLKVGFDAVESTDNAEVSSKQVGSYATVRSQDIVKDADVRDIYQHLYQEQQGIQRELDENFRQQCFFTALVCDGSGRVGERRKGDSPTLDVPKVDVVCIEPYDNTAGPVRFYALLEGSLNPVVVEYTFPLGMNPTALNLPAIGDRVMIFKSNGSFYFHSFLAPEYSSAAFSPQVRVSAVGARGGGSSGISHVKLMVWDDNQKIRNNSTHKYVTEGNTTSSSLTSSSFSNKDAAIIAAIKDHSIDRIVCGYKDQGVIANFYAAPNSAMTAKISANSHLSENYKTEARKSWSACCKQLADAYAQARTDVSSQEVKILGKQRELAEAVYHKTEETAKLRSELDGLNQTYKQLSDKLTGLEQSIIDCVTELKKDVLLTLGNFKIASSDLYSAGDLNITAGGTLRIEANAISLIAKSGAMSLLAKGSNNVTMSSELGTTEISSRNCKISINPYRIMQVATAYPNGTPFFSSTITLDQFQGVKISGSDFSASGWLGASLGDAFLGKIGVSNGIASINGSEVSVTVNQIAPLVANLGMLTLSLATDTAMLTTDHTSNNIDWKDLTDDERATTKDNLKSTVNLSLNTIFADFSRILQNGVSGKLTSLDNIKKKWNTPHVTYTHGEEKGSAEKHEQNPSVFEKLILVLRAILFVADNAIIVLDIIDAYTKIKKETLKEKYNKGTDQAIKDYMAAVTKDNKTPSFEDYLKKEHSFVNFMTEPHKYATNFTAEVKKYVTVTKIVTAYLNQLAMLIAQLGMAPTTYSKMTMRGSTTQFEGPMFEISTNTYSTANSALAGQNPAGAVGAGAQGAAEGNLNAVQRQNSAPNIGGNNNDQQPGDEIQRRNSV